MGEQFQAVNSCLDSFQTVQAQSIGWLSIPKGEIHVWRVVLEACESVERRLQQMLSTKEHIRRARFRSVRDRQRFTIRRGALRLVLGAYTGVPGSTLCFVNGKNGKPKKY